MGLNGGEIEGERIICILVKVEYIYIQISIHVLLMSVSVIYFFFFGYLQLIAKQKKIKRKIQYDNMTFNLFTGMLYDPANYD